MAFRFRLPSWCWLGALLLTAATGCVERRMIITTDPYGSIVYDEKNHPIGATTVDRPFTYYGTYNFRLAKDGYETIDVKENVSAPWYCWPGLDFFTENVLPFTIRDVRHFNYTMRPLQVVPPELLLQKVQELRDYGKTKGVELPPSLVGPRPAPVVMPPAGDPLVPNPGFLPPPPAPFGPAPNAPPPGGNVVPVPNAPVVPPPPTPSLTPAPNAPELPPAPVPGPPALPGVTPSR